MNTWLQFLTRNSATLSEGPDPEVTAFGGASASPAGGFVAPLTDLGIIAVTGDDAASFLHNQLTNDVERLGLGEARLAGYCSPKGRLLATFLMWKTADGVMLQLPRAIQAPVQKRLSMFVLRSKAKLADISESRVVLGLAGEAAAAALAPWFPELPQTPYAKVDGAAGTLIRVADAFGLPRYQWITDADHAQQAWPALTAVVPPAGTGMWRLAEIHAGVPRITQATQEQFVPQMVNFELIGGVNFKKGCYPGQEIVARSQYLGKLKRRTMLASVGAEAKAGMEVFSSADPGQPCGMIVNAERNDAGAADAATGNWDCLVEVKSASLTEGSIHLGAADGPALRFGALPYAFPDAV